MADSVNIRGLDDVLAKLHELSPKVQRGIERRVLRKAAKPILEQAKANAPMKTGKLRRSLKIRSLRSRKDKQQVGVRVGTANKGDGYYGYFHEFGWRIGKRPKIRLARNLELGVDHRQEVPPKPWARPAFDSRKDESVEIINTETGRLVEEAAQGQADGAD
jgi:HK97 gp10 family phage protein